MLFHQPILLYFAIWFCLVSSHEYKEDASDSRQLTSDEIGIVSTWTNEMDGNEHGKSTVESYRNMMSEIDENIQYLQRKYLPRDWYCFSVSP